MQLINERKSEKLLIFGITTYIFLLWFLPSSFAILTALLLGIDIIYILISSGLTIKFTLTIRYWCVFIIFQIFNLTFTSLSSLNNFTEGMEFIIYQIIFLMTYILLINSQRWLNIFYKNLSIVLAIYFFGSLLQLINPQLLTTFNKLHLGKDYIQYFLNFVNSGSLVGFTYQTTVNGYILSIFQGVLLVFIYKKKTFISKTFFIFLFTLNFYFLFLTGKRALIVFVMIAIILVIFALLKKKSHIIFVVVIMVILSWFFLYFTEAGNLILKRMELLESVGNVTAYRSQYNRMMWDDFIDKPLFGHGTYSTRSVINATNGHNIYLQGLRENGLFGFISFLIILCGNFLKGYISIFKCVEFENKLLLCLSVYCQIIFILWGATENPLYDVYPLFIYFCSIAVMDALILNGSSSDQIDYEISRRMSNSLGGQK